MPRRDEGASGITQRTKVQKDVWVDTAGNVVDQAGNIVISAAAQALVSPDGILVPDSSPLPYQADMGIDHIVSGLALPASGTIGVAAITSGVAYINGMRRAVAGQVLALTASRDNYVDLTDRGAIVVTPVTNGAAAPAVAVDAMRLGYVVTGASAASSRVTDAKDSLGNWMGNRSSVATCLLRRQNDASLGTSAFNLSFNSSTHAVLDNAGMHDATGNPTRITIPADGLYSVAWECTLNSGGNTDSVRVRVNGTADNRFPTKFTASTDRSPASNALMRLNAGDYLEVNVTPNASTPPYAFLTYFRVRRVA